MQQRGGWTIFEPSVDTRRVYVSSSSGSDANSGLADTRPKRTIAAGVALLRHGFPDWLHLRKGDEWHESLGHWKKCGRSESEPMVVSTYGESPSRPLLLTGDQGGVWTNGGGGSPATIDNLAIVGLAFHADGYRGVSNCDGAQFHQPGAHVLIEDCSFRGYSINLVLQGYEGRLRDYSVRRCVVLDSYIVHGTNGHSQGLYAYACDGLLIEGCVFDHNGWNDLVPGAGANIYNHNAYIDNGNTGVVVRGNIFSNASSHGMQLRCGGQAVDNLFLRNSIGLSIGGGNAPEHGGVTCDVRGNVILEGKDIDKENPRGWGMWLGNISSGVVERNVIARNTLGQQPVALTIDGTEGSGVRSLKVLSNAILDWGGGVQIEGIAEQIREVTLTKNEFTAGEESIRFSDHAAAANVKSAHLNTFHSNAYARELPSRMLLEKRYRETSKAYPRPAFTAAALTGYVKSGLGWL